MLFAIICIDKLGHEAVRLESRPDHVAFLKEEGEQVVLAGPFLSDDGATMIGSLLIYDAETLEEAKEFAAGDPYAKAGLFESVTIRPWRKVFDNR